MLEIEINGCNALNIKVATGSGKKMMSEEEQKRRKVWKQVVHQERQTEQKSEAKKWTVVAKTAERMSPSHEISYLVAFDYLLVKTE